MATPEQIQIGSTVRLKTAATQEMTVIEKSMKENWFLCIYFVEHLREFKYVELPAEALFVSK